MTLPPCITLDFETDRIEARPVYPPKPVGLAIRWQDGTAQYLAWGHPTGTNNCHIDAAKATLKRIWTSGAPLLFHNVKFDLAVAYEQMDMPVLPWQRIHDTMLLAFLCDPHAKSIGLKQLADKHLDMPPEEQDKLAEWVWDNRKQLVADHGGKVTRAKSGPNSAGAWISKVPGMLVGQYAIGDVERTWKLFDKLYPITTKLGMIEPYIRERRVMLCFMQNEREGLRVDTTRLADDTEAYGSYLSIIEDWLRKELRASGLNFDADSDVAEVFIKRGIVAEGDFAKTKTGKFSMSKETLLPEYYTDQRIARAFGYRNRLKTCLSMFMLPWLEQSSATNGTIHPNWNQVMGDAGGTRTGRPSCSKPNLLNISKDFEDRNDQYQHPDHIDVSPLPLVRRYILPDDGHVFLHRDYDGQEMRVFSHFEQGSLLQAYRQDTNLDPHSWVQDMVQDMTGMSLERTIVKNLNFLGLYGGGAPAVVKQVHCSLAQAKKYKAFHDKALPGRKMLTDEITRLVRRGEPIRTWGGRLYLPEPPKRYGSQIRTMEWKLINYLVQGSAADITKEAVANWYEHPAREARFLCTVYDEINISAPKDIATQQMILLKECMESVKLDVQMTTSGKAGPNWGSLEARG